MLTEVENDETRTVGHDRTTTIKNDETKVVSQGNETNTVKMGNRTMEVSRAISPQPSKWATWMRRSAWGTSPSNSISARARKMPCSPSTSTVGSSSIKIDQMGVTIKGMMITIEAQTMMTMKGLMTEVDGSAMLTAKGGIVMIN